MEGLKGLRDWFKGWNWTMLSWAVAIEEALLMVWAAFVLPGGDDLYRYYLPFAQGCLECGFVPYYARWVLYPLVWLPTRMTWPIWTTISLAGWLALCRWVGTNPALALLAFPAFGQIWLGQIDVLIGLGLALALLGKNPYLRGLGVALAMIKPQLSAFPLLLLLLYDHRWKETLILPALVLLLSLILFGLAWPLDWIGYASQHVPPHVWRLAAQDIWPLGILLCWVPFLLKREERFEAGLLVAAIASPFVGVYSYIVFLVLVRKPWWVPLLSYLWLVGYPIWQEGAMRLAWTLPLGLLVYKLVERVRLRADGAVSRA